MNKYLPERFSEDMDMDEFLEALAEIRFLREQEEIGFANAIARAFGT